MLIFYRIDECDLAQKETQGSQTRHANLRLLTQAHQAAASAIKHPLRNLQLTDSIIC